MFMIFLLRATENSTTDFQKEKEVLNSQFFQIVTVGFKRKMKEYLSILSEGEKWALKYKQPDGSRPLLLDSTFNLFTHSAPLKTQLGPDNRMHMLGNLYVNFHCKDN